MKPRAFFIVTAIQLSVVVPSTPVCAAEDDGFSSLPQSSGAVAAPVSAEALLRECLARLPDEAVSLSGWVRYRRPRGIVDIEFDFQALLRWGGPAPTAQYSFADKSGAALSRATFRWVGNVTEFVLQDGPALEPAQTPVWNASVHGTDITWLDLSMDFLRWPRAQLNGETKFRGRLCDIVEVYPPEPIPGCEKVRLLIDREVQMFLQAQQVDEEHHVVRQMWVRSVKKRNDRWMVQDMEVESRNSGHRTRLHVLSCD